MYRFLTALTSLAFVVACSDDPAPQSIPVGVGEDDGPGPVNGPGSTTVGNPGVGPGGGAGGDGPGPGSMPVVTPGDPVPGNTPVSPNVSPPPGNVPVAPDPMNGPDPVDPVMNTGGGGPGPVTPPTGNGGMPPSSGGTPPVNGGGMMAMAGTTGEAGSGPDLDENGKANAVPGEMTSTAQDYLRLGDIRILNNNWGSEDWGCFAPTSSMSVFVNQDSTFGWTFDRGDCDTGNTNSKPDFPQIEFGIHPFGIGSDLATSPNFSSTTLMPRQIKDITSASVSIQNLSISLERQANWNITFELWLSERDPINDPNPGVYAELMTFWGWENGRWPADGPGTVGACDGGSGCGSTVTAGEKTYTLWVQRDSWGEGSKWRYFQFRDNAGPSMSFNGTIDVKPLLDFLVNTRGYSSDLWVTRLEVGSEIDDDTKGTVKMSGITFEVNGESRSATLGN